MKSKLTKNAVLIVCWLIVTGLQCIAKPARLPFFQADDDRFHYTGRVLFAEKSLPRFWQPGVYIDLVFTGNEVDVVLNDELIGGEVHNYMEFILDGVASRLRLQSKSDTISLKALNQSASHHLRIMKDTEANIGWVEFAGVYAQSLLDPPAVKQRRIEFIGNSITCGAGSDPSLVPCGKGRWEDQHNAYLSYGSRTAAALKADFHLSAVSGIGLMHSCCKMDIIMPQVFDKMSMRNGEYPWDFNRFQPDIVTVTLGQNDGVQPADSFMFNYVSFLQTLRRYYPRAKIICLSSPMADSTLFAFLKSSITAVVDQRHQQGDEEVYQYFFSKQYAGGCDFHPTVEEHRLIAGELTAYIKTIMPW